MLRNSIKNGHWPNGVTAAAGSHSTWSSPKRIACNRPVLPGHDLHDAAPRGGLPSYEKICRTPAYSKPIPLQAAASTAGYRITCMNRRSFFVSC